MIEPISIDTNELTALVKYSADKWFKLSKLERSEIIGKHTVQLKDASENLVIFVEPEDILSDHEPGIAYQTRLKPKPVKCCPTCRRPLT